LQAIIASGRGDVLVKDLRFRCAECGSRLTDHVTMVKDALRVQPKFGRFVSEGGAVPRRAASDTLGDDCVPSIVTPEEDLADARGRHLAPVLA